MLVTNLPVDPTDPRAKPLLTIQLAKSKLYNAKQGLIQHYPDVHIRTGMVEYLNLSLW